MFDLFIVFSYSRCLFCLLLSWSRVTVVPAMAAGLYRPPEAAVIVGKRRAAVDYSTELRPPPPLPESRYPSDLGQPPDSNLSPVRESSYPSDLSQPPDSRQLSDLGPPPDFRYYSDDRQHQPPVQDYRYASDLGQPPVTDPLTVPTLDKRMSLAEVLYNRLNNRNRLKPFKVGGQWYVGYMRSET